MDPEVSIQKWNGVSALRPRNNKFPETRPGESADFWLISSVDRKAQLLQPSRARIQGIDDCPPHRVRRSKPSGRQVCQPLFDLDPSLSLAATAHPQNPGPRTRPSTAPRLVRTRLLGLTGRAFRSGLRTASYQPIFRKSVFAKLPLRFIFELARINGQPQGSDCSAVSNCNSDQET
ncbi:hypothetical protein N7532_008660 [Penicillium argentinense]|uniref:Uncharacterized protein n=1 Tax=Penicillium argentinense TaxID=1131581 RepID=A0A9W9EY12_9EURO|nr:uncharacterized protein N7532_008660 [Penicillium argentinense]KAJ5089976.1 hypothetical protein N7532_008660 [Penicillium argentinense]